MSSPYFFRLVKVAFALTILALLAVAALIPAPLQEQANLARVPNPAKSAWFLLWIQELVSYSKYLVYVVLALAACFVALPWLSRGTAGQHASWFARERLALDTAALAGFAIILVLTVVAIFFRGTNWQFIVPF